MIKELEPLCMVLGPILEKFAFSDGLVDWLLLLISIAASKSD
jgi:hypothetical protein